MESVFNKLRNRKILAILVVLFLIIIGAVILTNSQAKPIETPQQSSETAKAIDISHTHTPPPSQVLTSQAVQTSNWTYYTDYMFSLQYPQGWTIQNGQPIQGGELLIISPNNLPQGSNYPHIILDVEPTTQNQVMQKEILLKGLGLIESNIPLFGLSTVKLSGTIPFSVVNGQNSKQPIQETHILFVDGASFYDFSYDYEGANDNPTADELFNEFLAKIQIL